MKNLFALATSEIVSKGLMFLAFIYLARVLGSGVFGKFSFVTTFVVFFYITSQMGLDAFGSREIAKNHKKSRFYLNTIMSTKFLLAILNYFVLVCIAFIFFNNSSLFWFLIIFGTSIFANAMLTEFYFSGIQDMSPIGWGKVIRASILLVFSVLFVREAADLIWALLFYLLGHFVSTIYLLIKAYSQEKPNFNVSHWKKYLSVSVVIGIGAFMNSINFHIDKIIIPIYRDFSELGFYDAAVRVVFLFMILFSVVWNSFAPQITKMVHDKQNVDKIFQRFVRIISLFAFAITALTLVFADEIVFFLYGSSYGDSVLLLRLLSLAILLAGLKTIFIASLLAWHREKSILKIIAMCGILNLLANLLLIQVLGAFGAAVSTLLSGILIVIFGYTIIRKYVEVPIHILFKYFFAASFGGCLVFIVGSHWIFGTLMFLIIYTLTLYFMKEIYGEDLLFFVQVIRRK